MSEPKICKKSESVSETEKKAIMKTIEKNTEILVSLALETGSITFSNTDPKKVEESSALLINIMKNGSDVFQEKMGRPMYYSEMREMYG